MRTYRLESKPLIVLIVAAFFYLGVQLAARLLGAEEIGWSERASANALVGVALWIAINWLLSIPHALSGAALIILGAAAAATAVVIRKPATRRPRVRAMWMILLPLAGWVAFLMWRAWILPIGSADALIYHMPRALLLWRAGGYAWFPNVTDFRINGVAANYELLLSNILAAQHVDTIAEWTSILFFVLFLLVSTAIARRWWGSGNYLFATPYFVAAIPLVVLHAGAIKNDLMSHFFALSALLWGGRWFTTRRFGDAALCVIALFAGLGTKNHLLLLIAVIGLLFVVRAPSFRFVVTLAVTSVPAFLLLGGVHYFAAIRNSGGEGVAPAQYGQWENLWRFPADIFLAPFSSDDNNLVVPWRTTAIPWFRYDIYGSHYGQFVTIALLALPFVVWHFRRHGSGAPPAERHVVLAIGAAFFLLMMPIRAVPSGFASPFARYVLFVPVLIVCAAVMPLLAAIERMPRRETWVFASTMFTIVVVSLSSIAAYATHDKWMPLDYVLAVAHQADRRIYPAMPIRAAMVVDRIAGPADRIDVHGGHDTYLYPAYGNALRRDVRFINGPAMVHADAQWVIVDRADNIFWRHPGFKTAADWYRFWGRGEPSAEDVAVVEALKRDPRFRLVFYTPLIQAVFQRIH